MSEHDFDIEDHSGTGEDRPVCVGQWCCGCDEHPIGKPWGWNYRAWEEHNDRFHFADPVPPNPEGTE